MNSNTRGGAGNPVSCIHVDVTSEGALMTNDRNRIRGKKEQKVGEGRQVVMMDVGFYAKTRCLS